MDLGQERRLIQQRLHMLGGMAARAVMAVGPLALLVAAPVAAQTLPRTAATGTNSSTITVADTEDLEEGSSGVAGLPGFPGRGFHLDAQVQTRYDDNLSRRPVKDDGVRIRPKVAGSYGLGAGRIGLYVSGNYGRDIVRGNQLFRGADRHYYGAGVAAQLARCNIDGGLSFRQNLMFTADVGLAGQNERSSTQYGAVVGCQFGSSIGINAGVTRGDIRLVRRVTAAFDSDRMTYTAGLSFTRPALGSLSLNASVSDVEFTGRQVVTPDGLVDDGLQQSSLRLGYQRQFGSRIGMTVGVSYLDVTPSSDQSILVVDGVAQVVDRSQFSGIGYDGSLSLRLSPRLSLSASASRNVRSNGLVGAQFMVMELMEFGGTYQISKNLDFSTGVNLRTTQFRGAVVSVLEPQRRDRDRFQRYYANLGMGLGRRLRLAIDLSHNQRRSNPSLFNFDSTAVSMSLGFKLGK